MDLDRPMLLIMLGAAIVAGIFARTGRTLSRFEGIALVLAFIGFAAVSA